jgi:hypothetical protein
VSGVRCQPSRRLKNGWSNRKRNSKKAVRCLIQAIEVGSPIIKKPCHFGVASYERRLWPKDGQFNQKKTTFIPVPKY